MDPFFKIDATWQTQAIHKIGSFWTSVFADKPHMRALLGLVWKNHATNDFKSSLRNLAGNHAEARIATYIPVPFEERNVLKSGMLFYNDPERRHTYEEDSAILYGYYRLNYHGLKLKNIIPTSIESTSGTLVLGIDFFILVDRYIFFRDDPNKLFLNHQYVVISGIDRNYRSFISYMVKSNSIEYQDLIVDYFRHFQTPKYFRLALAAVGGLKILRKAQKLLEIHTTVTETIYTFETVTLRVDYNHDQLVVGTTYPDFFIIGGGIKLIRSDGTDRAWWREIDWRGGISLDPILPGIRGLSLLDETTAAYPAGVDAQSINGSKLHTRLKLSTDYTREKAYWELVAKRETKSGFYLNTLIKLAEESDSGDATILDTFSKLEAAYEGANELNKLMKWPEEYPDFLALPGAQQVNALDVFFRAMLADTAMVVLINPNNVKYPQEVYAFLNREMPVGCTPIILSYGPNLMIESMRPGVTIGVLESVRFDATAILTLAGETDELNTTMTDYAELKPEMPNES